MIARALVTMLAASAALAGCASTATLYRPLDGHPIVMSGTRLNLMALRDRELAARRFGAAAPRYPLLDLPLSAAADLFALGFTLPMAAVVALVDRKPDLPPPPRVE